MCLTFKHQKRVSPEVEIVLQGWRIEAVLRSMHHKKLFNLLCMQKYYNSLEYVAF